MASLSLDGIKTALVTPFKDDGSLNLDVTSELIEYQLSSGVSGIVVTAGAGEYVNLTQDERSELVRHASSALRGRVPLITGILEPDTGSAVTAAETAKEAGADAILLLTPYYISPSPGGLIEHFERVAQSVDLPIIIYNNPGRTGINLDLSILEELVRIEKIVGIKECDRDLGKVALKIRSLGDRITFLSGDDDLFLPILSIGARGGIMASTNIMAPWAVQCYADTKEERWDRAQDEFVNRLMPVIELYKGPDHPGPLKEAIGIAGFSVGRGRPPLHPVAENKRDMMSNVLQRLGVRDHVASFLRSGVA